MLKLSCVLLCLTLLCGASSTITQAATDTDAQAPSPETELTRGPLSFTDLTGAQNEELGTRDINGIIWHEFKKTATGGNFKYHARGLVLSGTISSFSLHGLRTLLTGNNIPALLVPPSGLTFTLKTDKVAHALVFGGKVRIPPGTSTTISNSREIHITGGSQLNQGGVLVFRVPTCDWSNAHFDFEQLPVGITANLRSTSATSFVLPLDTGSIAVSNGNFQAILPSLTSRSFEFSNQFSAAQVSNLKLNQLSVVVGRKTTLSASKLQIAGELVAIGDSETRAPILISGSLSLRTVTGTAEYSQEAATIHKLMLRGIRLKPPRDRGDSLHPTPVESRFVEQLHAASLTAVQKQSISASLGVLTAAGPVFDFTMNIPPAYVSKQIQDNSTQFGLKLGEPYFGRQELLALAEPLSQSPQAPRLQYVVRIVPQTSEKTLILRFGVATGQLSNLNIPKAIALSDLEAQVQAELKSAEANVAAAASQVNIDLPVQFTKQLNLNAHQTDQATGCSVQVTSTPATVNTKIVNSVLLLDEAGLHLLGRLEVE